MLMAVDALRQDLSQSLERSQHSIDPLFCAFEEQLFTRLNVSKNLSSFSCSVYEVTTDQGQVGLRLEWVHLLS